MVNGQVMASVHGLLVANASLFVLVVSIAIAEAQALTRPWENLSHELAH